MQAKRNHRAPTTPRSHVSGRVSAPSQEHEVDNVIVEELTSRLPTSELIKIIKGALDCGRENRPFTESDLLRAMTFGVTSTYLPGRQPRPAPRRRG
jgi:hypothetical protein